MITLLEFIARIAPFIYALAAIGGFFSLRGIVQARRALRVAVFGLEREAARERLRRSFSTLIILSLLAGSVYVIRNILIPNFSDELGEPTPTPLVFVTQQPSPTEALLLYPTVTPTIAVPAVGSDGQPVATADPNANGCEIIGANITNPIPGQNVSGQVPVEGQANILNFAQYKFEVSGPGTGGAWVVVGTALVPAEGYLGNWDSTSLVPGNYTLRLVVLNSSGTYPTPCQVPITIVGLGPSGGAPAP